MMIDIGQYEEGTWPGLLLVLNFEGVSLGHLTKIDIINLQQFLYYLQVKINFCYLWEKDMSILFLFSTLVREALVIEWRF